MPHDTTDIPASLTPPSTTAAGTASHADQPSSSKLILVVHDGNGTWHSVRALKLVGLTPEELEALEDGEESLLNELPFFSVLEALQHEHPDLSDDTWT